MPFLSFGQTPITDDNIDDAVDLWISNQDFAEIAYGHISDWDVSGVTDMSYLFQDANSFNEDIGGWDVSNVTNMAGMFSPDTYEGFLVCAFNQDIEADVSNVTNMSDMFRHATSFNQDISDWDVSNVTNMKTMFDWATSFNQDIGGWDVSNVSDMWGMFRYATSFSQDIGDWDVSSVTNMAMMFESAIYLIRILELGCK